MKAAGLLRTVDAMGRVVIPKSLRTQYGIDANTALEIFTDEQGIILRKYSNPRVLCGTQTAMTADGVVGGVRSHATQTAWDAAAASSAALTDKSPPILRHATPIHSSTLTKSAHPPASPAAQTTAKAPAAHTLPQPSADATTAPSPASCGFFRRRRAKRVRGGRRDWR